MTTTHIQHLAVVTLDEARTSLNDTDLVVIDGRITHLGKARRIWPPTRWSTGAG